MLALDIIQPDICKQRPVRDAIFAIALVNWSAFADSDTPLPSELDDEVILETIDKVRRVWTSRRERAYTIKVGGQTIEVWPIIRTCLQHLIPGLPANAKLTLDPRISAAMRDRNCGPCLLTLATLLLVIAPPRAHHRR